MKRLKSTVWLAGVVLVLAAVAVDLFTGSPTAHAASNGEWSVFPIAEDSDQPGVVPRPHFDYRVRAGAVIEDAVVVSNLTDEPLSLVLYPADAYNSLNAGQFTLDNLTDSRDEMGKWLRLGAGRFELPGNTEAIVEFTIEFPDDLPPGDYAGGIVALNEATEELSEGVGLVVQSAVGTRIYARVEGNESPALEISDLDLDLSTAAVEGVTGSGTGRLTYQVTNVGNLRLSGTAAASVTRTFGDEIDFDVVDVPELLPGENFTVTEEWTGLPPVGVVTAELTVTADEYAIEITRSTRSVVIPWVIIAVLVLLAAAIVYRRHKRRKAADTAEAVPELDDGDDVVEAVTGSRSEPGETSPEA